MTIIICCSDKHEIISHDKTATLRNDEENKEI